MYQSPDQAGPAVSAPAPSAPPARPRRRLAAAPWLILLAGVMALDLGLLQRHAATPAEAPTRQAAAAPLQAHLALLRGLLAALAQQPTTQDLLDSGDEDAALRWSLQLLRFLPAATAADLITRDGRRLGVVADAPTPSYAIEELPQWPSERLTRHIPVYPEPATHFDLLSPVRDEAGDLLGVLRVAFPLAPIEALLARQATAGVGLELLSGDGRPIARAGPGGEADEAGHPIEGTDWRLRLIRPSDQAALPLPWLAGLNLAALLLAAAGLYLQQRRQRRRLRRELNAIGGYLGQLAAAQARPLLPELRNTAVLRPALEALDRDLHRQRQQLARQNRRDPLTGLLNRRQFNEEFSRAYDFARRNMPVCVALVRLQGIDALDADAANQAVRALGRGLLKNSRKVDLAARLGDDRFALLLFDMKPTGVQPFLQRLQARFQSLWAEDHEVGIRCGYTLIHRHRDNDPAQVLARAEAALSAADDEHPIVGK